jgi:peptide/nickel transport system permease protein
VLVRCDVVTDDPLLQYIAKRLLIMVPTLFGIMILSFAIIKLAPGDPSALRYGSAGEAASGLRQRQGIEQAQAAFRDKWLLDEPLYVQFGAFFKRLATLDLVYFRNGQPILPELKERLLVSLKIELIVFFLIYAIAVPAGIYSAAFPHSRSDRAATMLLFVLYSLPSFWVAELLRIWLCHPDNKFPFPVSGLHSDDWQRLPAWGQFKDWLWHITLPVACMTYGGLAYISRQMRAGMLEVIRQDYIRTAEAKGCGKARTILVHALRNGLFPIITIFASLLPYLVSGSVIIESVFNIPGIGLYAYENVMAREYDVVMATLMLSAVMTLAGILISDVLYVLVNPRVSFDEGK